MRRKIPQKEFTAWKRFKYRFAFLNFFYYQISKSIHMNIILEQNK